MEPAFTSLYPVDSFMEGERRKRERCLGKIRRILSPLCSHLLWMWFLWEVWEPEDLQEERLLFESAWEKEFSIQCRLYSPGQGYKIDNEHWARSSSSLLTSHP